ncbi:hypothetical protein A9267_01100 [Shewanella sp. UCD-FRSSP16_17]|uniref:tRNA (adenine(22)-N(1))-methyltransferase n=1 Tax=Shewanella sp. UCD-FRSSP16_17 TaxID=1853256 RepID=UPI0007EEE794|nr:tRNA (adenine(22)-N(1))-methyltransferase TrmK [Shewanella sp. UCD-FRSSP16_17]OBT11281.1 hypothetical protein A9267_01100 [Shewanella sp. UCD-FRSSP16_17]
MKLSKRLLQICHMVEPGFDHIWDCCCDHGYLGAALLKQQSAKVHFVDIVPELMSNLSHKLNHFFADTNTWQTHCIDVSLLPLTQYQGHHLVIIAGIGGDLMSDLVTNILHAHPDQVIDILLCPVHHQFELRQNLSNLHLSLKAEVLIEENGRYYEVIHVTNNADKMRPISLTGELFWQTDCEKQKLINQQYLHKTLAHYQRIQKGQPLLVKNVINAYEQLL